MKVSKLQRIVTMLNDHQPDDIFSMILGYCGDDKNEAFGYFHKLVTRKEYRGNVEMTDRANQHNVRVFGWRA